MAKIDFHSKALREYFTSIDWYGRISVAARNRFRAEIERILRQIGNQPDRYAFFDESHREAIVSSYPYQIIYRVLESGDVEVVAVAHTSREPGYWSDRS